MNPQEQDHAAFPYPGNPSAPLSLLWNLLERCLPWRSAAFGFPSENNHPFPHFIILQFSQNLFPSPRCRPGAGSGRCPRRELDPGILCRGEEDPGILWVWDKRSSGQQLPQRPFSAWKQKVPGNGSIGKNPQIQFNDVLGLPLPILAGKIHWKGWIRSRDGINLPSQTPPSRKQGWEG